MNTQISDLIYYNSVDLFNTKYSSHYAKLADEIPGVRLFSFFYKLMAASATITDRTNTVIVPVKTHNLPFLNLPEYKVYTNSLEEISYNRARWLMDHTISTGRKLVISFSGGIDSTMLMVSFLKSCTEKELRENTLVLMNDITVYENRSFCEKYIYGKFDIDLTHKITKYLGDDNYVFLSGEGNDQLHGSSLTPTYFMSRGTRKMFSVLDKSDIRNFYYEILTGNKMGKTITLSDDSKKLLNENIEKVISVWDLSCSKSPIDIDNAYKYFWWVNFTMRWQAVYTRILSLLYTPKDLKLEDNYFMFYSPAEFQLWAMNNSDTLCGEDWSSYKQHCKNIIFDYTKDFEYNKFKIKIGSLQNLFANKKPTFSIDRYLNYSSEYSGIEIFNKNNTLAEYDN